MEKECLDLLKQIRNMHDKHPRDIENIIDALYWEYDCEKLTTTSKKQPQNKLSRHLAASTQ